MSVLLCLDKEQFLCSSKKKVRELFPILRDNGGSVERDKDGLSIPRPCFGDHELDGIHSSVLLPHHGDGTGAPSGGGGPMSPP